MRHIDAVRQVASAIFDQGKTESERRAALRRVARSLVDETDSAGIDAIGRLQSSIDRFDAFVEGDNGTADWRDDAYRRLCSALVRCAADAGSGDWNQPSGPAGQER